VRNASGYAGTPERILDYLRAVAESIADAGAALISGPVNAKTELIKCIRHRDPKPMKVIVGVETVDRPSDEQLVVHARKCFKAAGSNAAAEALSRK